MVRPHAVRFLSGASLHHLLPARDRGGPDGGSGGLSVLWLLVVGSRYVQIAKLARFLRAVGRSEDLSLDSLAQCRKCVGALKLGNP